MDVETGVVTLACADQWRVLLGIATPPTIRDGPLTMGAVALGLPDPETLWAKGVDEPPVGRASATC